MAHRKNSTEAESSYVIVHAGSNGFDFAKDEEARMEQVAKDVKELMESGYRTLPIVGGWNSNRHKQSQRLFQKGEGRKSYASYGTLGVIRQWQDAFAGIGMDVELVTGERRAINGDGGLQHRIRSQIDEILDQGIVPLMNEEDENVLQVFDMIDVVQARYLGVMTRRMEPGNGKMREWCAYNMDRDTAVRMFQGRELNDVLTAREAVLEHGLGKAFVFNGDDSTLLEHVEGRAQWGIEICDRRSEPRNKKAAHA